MLLITHSAFPECRMFWNHWTCWMRRWGYYKNGFTTSWRVGQILSVVTAYAVKRSRRWPPREPIKVVAELVVHQLFTRILQNYMRSWSDLEYDWKLMFIYLRARGRLHTRELKIETFSGRRRPDWQSNPGTEVAVASLQNSNIKIAVNSGGRRLGRLPKRKVWLRIKN